MMLIILALTISSSDVAKTIFALCPSPSKKTFSFSSKS